MNGFKFLTIAVAMAVAVIALPQVARGDRSGSADSSYSFGLIGSSSGISGGYVSFGTSYDDVARYHRGKHGGHSRYQGGHSRYYGGRHGSYRRHYGGRSYYSDYYYRSSPSFGYYYYNPRSYGYYGYYGRGYCPPRGGYHHYRYYR